MRSELRKLFEVKPYSGYPRQNDAAVDAAAGATINYNEGLAAGQRANAWIK